MFLLFPQWQGAGCVPGLREGSIRLAAMAGPIEWTTVDVHDSSGMTEEKSGLVELNIAWREGLLGNLRNARGALRQRMPDTVFTMGGDCSVELAPIAYLNSRFEGEITVVWLDAHADLNTPASSPSKTFHGMPLRHLLGEGDAEVLSLLACQLRPDQVVLAGVRENDPPEEAFIEAHQITKVSVTQMHETPSALGDLLMSRGARRLYVHLDLDVIDPDEFGAVGWPALGGLRIDALLLVLRDLGCRFKIAGVGMTEYLPADETELPVLQKILNGYLSLARSG